MYLGKYMCEKWMSVYEKWMRTAWDFIEIPFFMPAITWDYLACMFGPPLKPSVPNRRVKHSLAQHDRGSSRSPLLLFGNLTWMVCVASVLVKTAAFQGTKNDVSTAKMQLEGTYDHILRLDIAVELSPGTFLRYHAMEAKTK
jgi:hypothetical protein